MSGGREATSEQSSSICQSAGYDEVYPSGHEPDKDLSWSLAKEPSAQSPVEGEEGYKEDEWEEGDDREEGDDQEGGGDDNEWDESDEGVDIVFCSLLICLSDLEKSKNIIVSSWGRENIQNDVV